MNQQIKIEHLKNSDVPEALELFIRAFKDYPLIPVPQVKPELNKMLLKAAFDFYREDFMMLYGIRKNGRLICASLSARSPKKLSVLPLIRLVPLMIRLNILVIRALGWRIVRKIGYFFRWLLKEKPKHKGPYLELVLLGTLPECQGQGFGRKMLRFLYNKAKEKEYKGVILSTNRDTPAFRLYMKEGFIVDKEFTLGETTLCWMRLTF